MDTDGVKLFVLLFCCCDFYYHPSSGIKKESHPSGGMDISIWISRTKQKIGMNISIEWHFTQIGCVSKLSILGSILSFAILISV